MSPNTGAGERQWVWVATLLGPLVLPSRTFHMELTGESQLLKQNIGIHGRHTPLRHRFRSKMRAVLHFLSKQIYSEVNHSMDVTRVMELTHLLLCWWILFWWDLHFGDTSCSILSQHKLFLSPSFSFPFLLYGQGWKELEISHKNHEDTNNFAS